MSTWTYRPANIVGVVELGSWCGKGSPALKRHFHDEDQIVFVLSGSRSFLIQDEVLRLTAGKAVYIPAETPHTPIATMDNGTTCLNAYIPMNGRSAQSLSVFDIRDRWLSADGIDVAKFLRDWNDTEPHVEQPAPLNATEKKLRITLSNSLGRIGDLATSLGRSREGFSRLVRHEIGVAPHAFRVLARLNHARQLLRAGEPIAAVAVETGFADQSHMSRLFRSTFGTTPGLYRRG